jgi:cytoplasmic iron level regulating protein YaaA (DUF328/UPF0246 family)
MLLALLSPAKRLNFAGDDLVARGALKATTPALASDTKALAARAKRYTVTDLRRLMDLSPALAKLNHERFQAFAKADKRAAIYAFAGDVYQGFDAASLDAKDIAFAQDHVAMLSGLYGLLRPLDLIAPYRLEMHSKVDTDRGEDLYDFWRERLTDHINARLAEMRKPVLVNLASQEYWSAVEPARVKAPIIQALFKQIKGGKAVITPIFAKKARGLMARYIVESRAQVPEDLKGFTTEGYRFDARASDDHTLVFSRKSP